MKKLCLCPAELAYLQYSRRFAIFLHVLYEVGGYVMDWTVKDM